MRSLTLVLLLVLAAIQYPLWVGKGGWMRVWEMERQLAAQQEHLGDLRTRNTALDAEVRDLKSGTDAIEERARFELGMIKEHEMFVQLVDAPPPGTPGGPAVAPAPARPGAPAAARPAAAPASTPAPTPRR
jgi:cell division protein FtsB